ncbi:hypothetical protein [Aliamphritea ceti]|uniref:hypothetical protein n=1 Tax=Aliamphritea ceti TaxID=1524258 RepID=UPI0021C4BADE|nr:hypothetical protein [Aliamphritea ceti]
MKGIKLISLVFLCSSLSSFVTWHYVQSSNDAGYDLIGLMCNSSTVSLNTKVLSLESDDELRCHLAKHTSWMVEDLEAAEIPDKYIIAGPGLPRMTRSFLSESVGEYNSTQLKKYASECEVKEKLF